MDNYVITIARGHGAGGSDIGKLFAERHGIKCYNTEILQMASKLSGIEEYRFEKNDEKLGTFRKFSADDELFEYQANVIRHLAETESCVIIGKCADYILDEYSNVVSVYVDAPRPATRGRIMRKKGIGPDEADREIARTDKYYADYYEHFTGRNNWEDITNYDICLNSLTLGIEKCVDMIDYCLQRKLGDKLGLNVK